MSSINLNNQIVENKQNSILSYVPVGAIKNSALGVSALVLMNLPTVVASQATQSIPTEYITVPLTIVGGCVVGKWALNIVRGYLIPKRNMPNRPMNLEEIDHEIKYDISKIDRIINRSDLIPNLIEKSDNSYWSSKKFSRLQDSEGSEEIKYLLTKVAGQIKYVISNLEKDIKSINLNKSILNEDLNNINNIKNCLQAGNNAEAIKILNKLPLLKNIKVLISSDKVSEAVAALDAIVIKIKEKIEDCEKNIDKSKSLKAKYENDKIQLEQSNLYLKSSLYTSAQLAFNKFYKEKKIEVGIQTDPVDFQKEEKDTLTNRLKKSERKNKKLSDENMGLKEYADENDKELVDANLMNRTARRKLQESKRLSGRSRPAPAGSLSDKDAKIKAAYDQLTKDERKKIKTILKNQSSDEKKQISKQWGILTPEALFLTLRQLASQ